MPEVRVATYNVRHCLGRDARIDVERTASVISESGASLVALQELDQKRRRSGRVDQPAKLAELTGMHVQFWTTVRKRDGKYGVGLATSEPVDARFEILPRVGSEERRLVVVTSFRGLTVAATHLGVRREVCRVQTLALAELVGSLASPFILLGDLNQPRSSLGPLIAAGLDPGPQPDGLRTQIDYVMTGPGVSTIRAWTIPSQASDHLPLVADLEAPAPTAL